MNNDYISRREHEEYVKRMEDEHKRLNKRMEKCEQISEQMQDMNANISELATHMKHLLDEQIEQRKRLDRIEDEPKDAWNSIKKGLFNAIGAALGGALIAAIIYFI